MEQHTTSSQEHRLPQIPVLPEQSPSYQESQRGRYFDKLGTEMALNWYYRRIIQVIDRMNENCRQILPINRKNVNAFIGAPMFRWFIDHILLGLKDPIAMDDIDWNRNHLFLRFKHHISQQESEMEQALRTVAYYVDCGSTLQMITRGGDPEQYVLPLIYLLLRYAFSIIQSAASTEVSGRKLSQNEQSIRTVRRAVRERVKDMEAGYRIQNRDPEEQIRDFNHGIFSYILGNNVPVGDFWTRQAVPVDNISMYEEANDDMQTDLSVDTVRCVSFNNDECEIKHRDAICDNCTSTKRDVISGARLMCIECSMHPNIHTAVDYCSTCFRKGFDHLLDADGRSHCPDHRATELPAPYIRNDCLPYKVCGGDSWTRRFYLRKHTPEA